nr:PREDICTED: extensin-like [Anolis carolinensis]|eukprot:XP_016854423.1 PREDICTED: extensin-like [Anolis carolinensis]
MRLDTRAHALGTEARKAHNAEEGQATTSIPTIPSPERISPAQHLLSPKAASYSHDLFQSPPRRSTWSEPPMHSALPPLHEDLIHRSPGGREYFFGPVAAFNQAQPSLLSPQDPPLMTQPSYQHEEPPQYLSASDSESYISEGDQAGPPPPDPAPPEEMLTFSALITRLSRALALPIPNPQKPIEDPLFPSEQQQTPTPAMVLPPLPYLLQLARTPDTPPFAVPPVSRRCDSLYRIDLTSALWAARPPKPNSLAIKVTQGRCSSKSCPTPADKEGRKLEGLGKKVHLTAGFVTRLAHYGAYMASYQDYLWKKVGPYLDMLPSQHRYSSRTPQVPCFHGR